MSKHTRGPWVKVRINGHWHIAGYDGRLEVATVTALMDKEQSDANANLLQSAPETLAALEGVVENMEGDISLMLDHEVDCPGQEECCLCKARAAIKKAKGEA